jgi:hypothetical protein
VPASRTPLIKHRSVRGKEPFMRSGFIAAVVIVLAVIVAGVSNVSRQADAQDSTPAAGQQATPPAGVTVRSLATDSIEVLEPGMASLNFGRIELAPGGVYHFDPMDRSAVLLVAATGAMRVEVAAPMTVKRRIQPGTPVPSTPEAVPANTAFTMRAGDSTLFPPGLTGEIRNERDVEAAAWVIAVALTSGGPATPGAGDANSTPAP